jgi:hypothetical protein
MKNKRRKAKRAAEIGTATAIVLGLGAAVVGVALYNHFKAPATTPPLVPGLNPSPVNPPTTATPTPIAPNPR